MLKRAGIVGAVAALIVGLAAMVTGTADAAPGDTQLVSVDAAGAPLAAPSNRSPSISGDGRYVAFTNDPGGTAAVTGITAYVRDRTAAASTPVPSLGTDAQGRPLSTRDAVVSRTGCRVAYIGTHDLGGGDFSPGEDLFLSDCSGAPPRQLFPKEAADQFPSPAQIAISSDGTYVAVTLVRGNVSRVVVVNTVANTTVTIPTTAARASNSSTPALSATKLAFVTDRGFPPQPGEATSRQMVWVWNLGTDVTDGAQYQQASAPLPAGVVATAADVAISGDGTKVGFTLNGQLTIRDLGAAAPKAFPPDTGARRPAWSQDGSTLAYQRVSTVCAGCSEVAVVRSTAGFFDSATTPDVIAPVGGAAGETEVGNPRLSSTAQFVAFTGNPGRFVQAQQDTSNLASRQVFVRERGLPPPPTTTTTATTAPPRPAAVSVTPLDFGSAPVGATSGTLTATASNTGQTPFVPDAITTGSTEFAVTGGTCQPGVAVPAGAACSVTVVFQPAAAGTRNATLTLTQASPALAATGSLTGAGVAPPPTPSPQLTIAPTTADFGITAVGIPATPQSFTVRNTGNGDNTIAGVALGLGQAADFALAGNSCGGATLAVNQTCAVSVIFTAHDSGVRTANLVVTGTGGSAATATLRGTGQFQPTMVFSWAVVPAGRATTLVGLGFPAATNVTLAFEGIGGAVTVTTDAGGGFSLPVFVLPGGGTGTRIMRAEDQPGRFTAVTAPLLVTAATYQPQSATGPAFRGGAALVSRG